MLAQEVITRLKELSIRRVLELKGVEEYIVFPNPKPLKVSN